MDKNYGYKHTKGFILFILMVLLMAVVSVYAQSVDSTTGNVINNTTTANTVTSTWQNAGTINQPITCWAPGDPGYCGPQPYVNAWGSPNQINFSYGFTELYQVVNVSKALPNSGTGLVTTGFIFNWRSKNGNEWDDARQDELKAYVQGYTKSGKWIENFNYDLNFKHSWTDFTWNQNWSQLRRPDDLANVVFGFAGKDNNFWAGAYGPEIINVSFQLKYKPDPCIKNPLFSPECPKFNEALDATKATTTTTNIETTNQNTQYPVTEIAKSDVNKTEKFEFDDLQQPDENKLMNSYTNLEMALTRILDKQEKDQEASINVAQEAVSKTEQFSKQVVKQAESIAKEKQSQSLKESEHKPVIEQGVLSKKDNQDSMFSLLPGVNSNSSNNTGFSLPSPVTFKVQIEQPKETTQVTNTQPSSIIGQNNSTAFNTFIKSETQQNTNSTFGTVNDSKPITASVLVFAPLNQSSNSNLQTTEVITNNVPINQPLAAPIRAETPIVTNLEIQQPLSILEKNTSIVTTTAINPVVIANIDVPTITTNFLTNKTDPVNQILENSQNMKSEEKVESKQQAVKTNVQDNDVAGAVNLSQIAVTPVGYNQYTNFILRDVAFYAPKEIYRGQRTVDNARALRNLSSDRLHQDMIDLQYRR